MALDIRGGIKNTQLSSNLYVVFEELISNSIDAYLIRKNNASSPKLYIEIEVSLLHEDMFGGKGVQENMTIMCRDNGCGLGDSQYEAFLTKDTSYKDDLNIFGIGRCKGSGRIQYFHHFSKLALSSVYKKGEKLVLRTGNYEDPKTTLDSSDFQEIEIDEEKEIGFEIVLSNLKDVVRNKLVKRGDTLHDMFSASELKRKMLISFMQRLIGLKDDLGDFQISFKTVYHGHSESSDELTQNDLPVEVEIRDIQIQERNPNSGEILESYEIFKISHYQIDAREHDLSRNSIVFCAKSTFVEDITSRYLKTKPEQNMPINGFYHIVFIESDYLDRHVNVQRDGFENIPLEIPYEDMFMEERIAYSSIYDAIDDIIFEMVTPIDWDKNQIISDMNNQFGISEMMLQDTVTRIRHGDTSQDIAERVLKKYQARVINETAEIFNLKEEIISVEPDSEDFRKKINEISWKYTASLRNIDMANLSQLIVRRTAIVQILDLACSKGLAIQQDLGKRQKNEALIHNVFFPMRKDSKECIDHDIWLLSEEYQYYDYIASDVPLANICWEGDTKLFASDIDASFAELLAKRFKDNSGKRPDIALFSKEGSVIIIEFKAPGVSMDEHIGDLTEYSHLLAAKSGGKLKKFYGYLIGDTVNELRMNNWTPFPLGDGWFQSGSLMDPKSRQPLGETYFEILHFNDVIERAKRRIEVYQNKLSLNLDTVLEGYVLQQTEEA